MALTLLFLVLWLLATLALHALVVRFSPGLRGRRGALLAIGVLALAAVYPLMRHISESAPPPANALRWPAGTKLPLPRDVSPALLTRLPFSTVSGNDLAARALFVEASRRRPVAVMALRLEREATAQVQRFLVLHGDSLELVVDERRRSDGRGRLYAFPLESVVLGACSGNECSAVDPDAVAPTGMAYRILGRFPGDTLHAVRF